VDKQVKEVWVNALRSGDYDQGQAWLKKGDSYCCLGVLCDLYLADHDRVWEANDDEERPSDIYGEYSVDNNTEMLPKNVAKWAGIDEDTYHDGCVSVRGETLTGLNDSGHSFDEIASIIEECL
jgi:hypothetical protein